MIGQLGFGHRAFLGHWFLGIRHWAFFGHWFLVIGHFSRGCLCLLDQSASDLLGVDPLGLGRESSDDAMG